MPLRFTQASFRARNDNGSESTATWKFGLNANWTQATGVNFRVRFATDNSSTAGALVALLQYRKNAGAWTAVTDTSANVQASATTNYADGDATSKQISINATWIAGSVDEVNGQCASVTLTPAGAGTEHEFCLKLIDADVANGDTIELRLTNNGTAFWAYTNTPAITVTKPFTPATAALTVTGYAAVLKTTLAVAAVSLALTGMAPSLAADAKLTGSVDLAPSGDRNLTTIGTEDWAHWGRVSGLDFNHKSTGGTKISDLSLVGSAGRAYSDFPFVTFTWTDGTPTESATNQASGVFTSTGLDSGFSFTVPADQTERTLKVFVSVWDTQGKLSASLSGGAVPDYVSTEVDGSADGGAADHPGEYTINYKADTAAQTLTVTWTQNTSKAGASLILAAATLGGISNDVSLTPDAATITLAGLAPEVLTTVVPGAGALTCTGYAPVVATVLSPGASALTCTGYAPAVKTAVSPGAGAITCTGYAPALSGTITVGTGALTCTGYAPEFLGGANVALVPDPGAITATGYAPSVTVTLSPNAGAITCTGYAPSLHSYTFTSKAIGNWGAAGQTTWNEAGIPGPNDLVLISHLVTVAADGDCGTVTIDVNGTLSVADNITLRVHGGTVEDYSDGGIILGENASIEFIDAFLPGPASLTITGFAPKVAAYDFTSKAIGAWDAVGQTTWNEPGCPGPGDTVLVSHLVTVGVESSCLALTIDNAGTVSILANQTLWLYSSAFENYGSLSLESNARLAFIAGAAVSPDVATLAVTGYAPALLQNYRFSPATAVLTVTGYAPSLDSNVSLSPATGAISVTGFAPAVLKNERFSPATATITCAGFGPVTKQTYTPAAGTLALTGNAVSLYQVCRFAPATGTLTITGHAPTVSATAHVGVQPGTGAITLTGFTPSLGGISVVATSPAAVVVAGQAPTLKLSVAAPAIGTLAIVGRAPTLRTTLAVPTASLTLQGLTAGLNGTSVYSPSQASLTLTGFAPSVVRTVVPAAATMAVTGYAPVLVTKVIPGTAIIGIVAAQPAVQKTEWVTTTIGVYTGFLFVGGNGLTVKVTNNKLAIPAAGVLTATGYQPALHLTTNISPAAGVLNVAGHAPTLAATAHQWFSPNPAAIVLSGHAPGIAGIINLAVDAGALTLAGQSPSALVTDHKWFAVEVGAITVTGHAPALQVGTVVYPDPGALLAEGFAATVALTDHKTFAPDCAVLTLSGKGSLVAITGITSLYPDAGALGVTGYAPDLQATGHQWLDVAVGEVLVEGFAPGVVLETNTYLFPASGTLTVLGYAPTTDSPAVIVIDLPRLNFEPIILTPIILRYT